MTLTDTQNARLNALSDGRASGARVKDGVLTLILDVTGLDDARRSGIAAAIRAEFDGKDGITAIRIAETAEKHSLRILAVASGKGGVGKSTVATNLAVALSRLGMKVGVLDADIYGPSQHRLLGTEGQRPTASEKQMIPVKGAGGIPMLSMGQLVDAEQAIAWRGSMATGAMGQMMDARWGDVDVLVVDLPPGTGDIQLTLIQKYKPVGAVIVSTPQDLALIDATRAVRLFEQVEVPIIGLIENMSGYICPHCGEMSDPFGAGGAEAAAKRMDLHFLGRIPLSIDIRTRSDAGQPPALEEGVSGGAFHALAEQVRDFLSRH